DDARAALMDVIASKLSEEAEKRKTGIDKTKDLLKRIDWLRTAKLTAGSAIALAAGVPPTGLIGELYDLVKKVGTGQVDDSTIKAAEKAASDAGSAMKGIWKTKTTSSPPKEI